MCTLLPTYRNANLTTWYALYL